MALIFNEGTVSSEQTAAGVRRQALLDERRVSGIDFRLERLALGTSAKLELRIPKSSLAWFQILEGTAQLVHGGQRASVTEANVVFLPPDFVGHLESEPGATLLFAEVEDVGRIDPSFGREPLDLRIVDWTHEPVLLSEHDARKRIYLVTPKLFGTKAIKGEMIIYPPGTEAAKHHHEGAAHFMYVLTGAGTVFANDVPAEVRKGDVIYYPDRETHYLRSNPDGEMRFVEFFVPGNYKTVWAEGASVCTWNPAGTDIRGNKAAREIQAHSSAKPTSDI